MTERKPLHPEGIDRLRAAVVGQAVKDCLDLCRVKDGKIPIPYKLSKSEMAIIRHLYFQRGLNASEIAEKMRINKQAVFSVLSRQNKYLKNNTCFYETKATLKKWFESDDFNMVWCNEPGENITRHIEKLAEEDRKNKSKTRALVMKRKIYNACNEEMGV